MNSPGGRFATAMMAAYGLAAAIRIVMNELRVRRTMVLPYAGAAPWEGVPLLQLHPRHTLQHYDDPLERSLHALPLARLRQALFILIALYFMMNLEAGQNLVLPFPGYSGNHF